MRDDQDLHEDTPSDHQDEPRDSENETSSLEEEERNILRQSLRDIAEDVRRCEERIEEVLEDQREWAAEGIRALRKRMIEQGMPIDKTHIIHVPKHGRNLPDLYLAGSRLIQVQNGYHEYMEELLRRHKLSLLNHKEPSFAEFQTACRHFSETQVSIDEIYTSMLRRKDFLLDLRREIDRLPWIDGLRQEDPEIESEILKAEIYTDKLLHEMNKVFRHEPAFRFQIFEVYQSVLRRFSQGYATGVPQLNGESTA